MGATPYPETEPLFVLDDPELERLRKAWEKENREYYAHQRQRGWGDRSVRIGPGGPTNAKAKVATRSRA